MLVAEADKPLLDSLRGPCDWDVSALSRATLMIRFLAGKGVTGLGSDQVRRVECCWKVHWLWSESLCQCAQPRSGTEEGVKSIAKEHVEEGIMNLTRSINNR
jgi:hypothetical protein